MILAMTFVGALIAVPIAWLLKKTLFRGETPPFVMELPSYKWPSPRIVLNRAVARTTARQHLPTAAATPDGGSTWGIKAPRSRCEWFAVQAL